MCQYDENDDDKYKYDVYNEDCLENRTHEENYITENDGKVKTEMYVPGTTYKELTIADEKASSDDHHPGFFQKASTKVLFAIAIILALIIGIILIYYIRHTICHIPREIREVDPPLSKDNPSTGITTPPHVPPQTPQKSQTPLQSTISSSSTLDDTQNTTNDDERITINYIDKYEGSSQESVSSSPRGRPPSLDDSTKNDPLHPRSPPEIQHPPPQSIPHDTSDDIVRPLLHMGSQNTNPEPLLPIQLPNTRDYYSPPRTIVVEPTLVHHGRQGSDTSYQHQHSPLSGNPRPDSSTLEAPTDSTGPPAPGIPPSRSQSRRGRSHRGQ
ncbi:7191_t:CDS:2 [Funneliformis geosporum]|uniref:7191_t:CDS:1 n=1 Tax=Funneliformis geosporum TaxID=1117311 RepID=A0A9W4STL4_9GLOM|nr:7191_t:CDS:2 [Funneliformis geosporum]